MKKRVLSMVLACMLAFSAAACGKDDSTQGGQTRQDAAGGTDAAQDMESGTGGQEEDGSQPVWVEPEKEEPVIDWSAVETAPEEDFWFTDITVSGFEGLEVRAYYGEGGVVKIPESYNGKPVISIRKETFQDTEVTDVYISGEYIRIGTRAFAGCASLRSIVIIGGAESLINERAFADCENLTSVVISEDIVEFWGYVFEGTPWLENKRQENPLVIVNNVVLDGQLCTGDVVLPEGIVKIAPSAFQENENIISVVLPDSIRRIEIWAFSGCTSLKSINIPDNMESITGIDAFNGCVEVSATYQGKTYTLLELDNLQSIIWNR
ncbi:MAG: leucine-rich repeat domain-containing protein [Lachnospiraceae bacterium]|nr:leucine-rich repeat domain-containing protein [Lachnospiraceae bacterium]